MSLTQSWQKNWQDHCFFLFSTIKARVGVSAWKSGGGGAMASWRPPQFQPLCSIVSQAIPFNLREKEGLLNFTYIIVHAPRSWSNQSDCNFFSITIVRHPCSNYTLLLIKHCMPILEDRPACAMQYKLNLTIVWCHVKQPISLHSSSTTLYNILQVVRSSFPMRLKGVACKTNHCIKPPMQ